MKSKLVLLLHFLFLISIYTNAQTDQAPTLTVGLSGLTGAKGMIDVDVLSDLLSSKQDEIRKEAITRILRKGFENGSYTFYSFANQCITNLFNNKDATATKRKLVENITNLAMVYGFSEFYLRTSNSLMHNVELKEVINLSNTKMLDPAIQQYWQSRLIDRPSNTLTSLGSIESITASIQNTNQTYTQIVSNYYDTIIPQLRELKPMLEEKFKQEFRMEDYPQTNFFSVSNFMLNKLKPESISKNNLPLSEVLLDMIYDIMLRNKELEKLGFFKISREVQSEQYQELNKYLYLMNNANDASLMDDLGMNSAALVNYRDHLKALKDRIEIQVSLLLKNYLMVKEQMNKEMSITELVSHYRVRMDTVLNYSSFSYALNATIKKVNDSIKILKQDSLVKQTNEFVRFLKGLKNRTNLVFTDDDIRLFKDKHYNTKAMLMAKGILKDDDDKLFDKLYAFVWYTRLHSLQQKIINFNFGNLSKISLTTFSDFMQLLSNLGSLDKAKTYDEVFRLVMNAGYMYDDYSNTAVFNNLVGTIEKYTNIDAENNKIDINVEDIMITFYDKWVGKSKNAFSFCFTIGIAQSYKGVVPPQDSALYNPKSFAFASEKIGIRWNFYNPERLKVSSCNLRKRYLQKNGVDKTFITNGNLTLYGSGLLYNIANTTTNSTFKYSMVGLSTGVQFFNTLEANVFLCSPIIGDMNFEKNIQTYQLAGVSFDLPITEYLSAVRKKREEKKIEKQKAEQLALSNNQKEQSQKVEIQIKNDTNSK